jgi:phosphoribosylamine--glycine ligase
VKVLVVGGGGREHALCWFLARSATVYCAPGNPGTASVGTNLPINVADHRAVADAVRQHHIDLVVVGPEAPLAAGLVDDLATNGIAAFGPTARAARIESSKAFAKEVMARANVPTARSMTFTDQAAALKYIDAHAEPVVVKASGLAAGKGAVVCQTRSEARAVATEMLSGRFGTAGYEIVIEEFLSGEELSILALTDGEQVCLLPASQDHKRLLDRDVGPNTGGMGAYAPVSIAKPALLDRIERTILLPTLKQLAAEEAPYRGVLYAGLMIAPDGSPAVIEFNCRLGDPETQAVLPITRRALLDDFWAIASKERWQPAGNGSSEVAVTTVLAAAGYPDSPAKGMPIRVPKELPPNTMLFHAGTDVDSAGVLRVNGGRVLSATGTGLDIKSAQAASQALADAVQFEGKAHRRDIGWREVARARAT